MIGQFAGFNPQPEPVLPGRQRTGGEGIIGAWRVVGGVEIQNQPAVARQRSVQKTGRPVGLSAARRVSKHKEQLVRSPDDRLQTHGLPAQFKDDLARTLKTLSISQNVEHGDRLGALVGLKTRLDPVGRINRKPAQAGERLAQRVVGVSEPKGKALAAGVNPQAQPADAERVRGGAHPKAGGLDFFSVLPHLDPRFGPKRRRTVLKPEDADMGRRRVGWQDDVIVRSAADPVVAGLEPVQAGYGEPAGLRPETRLALLAPGFDALRVRLLLADRRFGQ